MRIMVSVKATFSSEAGISHGDWIQKMLREMRQYTEQLIPAGIMRSGEGLKPSSSGVRVLFSGAETR